jgi:hypothetical protein
LARRLPVILLDDLLFGQISSDRSQFVCQEIVIVGIDMLHEDAVKNYHGD